MIVNFWFIVSDVIVNSLVGASAAAEEALNQEPPGLNQAVKKQPGQTFITAYVRGEYGELTPLRENLQYLEERYPGQFVVAGCWDFDTGAPVGGAGSPWFRSPPELLDYMPGEVNQDLIKVYGQAGRNFV